MKTISLWQPWATLIAIGAKRVETRSWATRYTGPLAIHAAQRHGQDQIDFMVSGPCRSALQQRGLKREMRHVDGFHADQIPLGCIVATCTLFDCVKIESETIWPGGFLSDFHLPPDEPERSFGDYRPGRYAWLLYDVLKLARPLPWRGSQGFFDVPDALVREAVET